MKFGEKVKKLRLEKGLTQEEVAKAISVSRQAYNAYEQGGVRPRKRDTYVRLAKILQCDVDYLMKEENNGLWGLATLGAMSTVIPFVGPAVVAATITGVSITEKKRKEEDKDNDFNHQPNLYASERLAEYTKQLHKFSAMAMGMIYGQMTKKGVRFQPCNNKEIGFPCYEDDMAVNIADDNINTWLFEFVVLSENDRSLDKFAKDLSLNMISRLIFIPPDKKRKISIVVNDREIYEYILQYKGLNSYRGNLSVIYIDTNEVMIRSEEYLSTYDLEITEKVLEIV